MPRHRTRPGYAPVNFIQINFRGPDDLRKRLKVAVAEDGFNSYWELVWDLLDQRERRREAARRAQPSPLHRPRPGHGIEGSTDTEAVL